MKYITFQEIIMQNAIRHKMRMERYLCLGMYNHACGSFRKFHRNYQRSRKLIIEVYPGINLNILADRVADSILNNCDASPDC